MTWVERLQVHAPAIRVRARLVEALSTAAIAENMLSLPRAKPVAGQAVRAGKQLKLLMRNEEVQIA